MTLMRAETGVKSRVDWGLVAVVAGLLVLGTVAVMSAASPLFYYGSILKRHFIALLLGTVLFIIGLGLNYQIYQDQARIVYGLVLLLMIAVLIVGSTQRGHKAWFQISFLTFQPAELARLGVILVLAAFLDARVRKIHEFSTLLLAAAIAGPVMALILKQPDFSSTLTFFPMLFAMLFCAGASVAHLAALTGFGAVAVAVPILIVYLQVRYPQAQPGTAAYFILQTARAGGATAALFAGAFAVSLAAWRLLSWMRVSVRPAAFLLAPALFCAGYGAGLAVNKQLKGYQRNRFVAYLAPHTDIQGAAYNVRQSQIAIGSGGILGKGLFAGTQSKLGFLPERHTDFIYAVVGEEMGFWGAGGILALYLALIYRIVAAARSARDRYGFLVCTGLAATFSFQLLLNVGMCLGLMPVAGIPLPLISYGGSSLVITLWSLGIVANVYARRYALL